MNLLDSLKRYTTVVADTGDIDSIAEYQPEDATTNPSLLFQAAKQPRYEHLVNDALRHAIDLPGDRTARTEAFMDKLLVNFGTEILKLGRPTRRRSISTRRRSAGCTTRRRWRSRSSARGFASSPPTPASSSS